MRSQQAHLCEPHHGVFDAALDGPLRDAHTSPKWLDRKVPADLLMAVYDLTRIGPNATNITPLRIVFVVSAQAKARLKPHLSQGDVRQSMEAPVTAILGNEHNLHRHLAFLNRNGPNTQSHHSESLANIIPALCNGRLQGDYFILAARALGLICEPMDGFNHAGIDTEFFVGSAIKSNFLCNLGYAVQAGTLARNQHLGFDEACQIL